MINARNVKEQGYKTVPRANDVTRTFKVYEYSAMRWSRLRSNTGDERTLTHWIHALLFSRYMLTSAIHTYLCMYDHCIHLEKSTQHLKTVFL